MDRLFLQQLCRLLLQPGFERLITSEGFIRCLPDMLDGIDGFFAARLQKQAT